MMKMLSPRLALLAAVSTLAACASTSDSQSMSFFVTSTGSGKGADFGGLAGADAHCQKLATAVGAGGKRWAAYLSATAAGGSPAVDARDRIGKGPWRNAKGEVIANSVDELHGGTNKLTKTSALTEKGTVVNGRGDTPNEHDVLTGSTPEGRSSGATCDNWASSGAGAATVGHSDRTGLDESAPAKSWNSSHPTRGCGPDALKTTGGAGYLYCFATN